MQATAQQPTLLSDYRPFPYLLTDTDLTFALSPRATRVKARLSFAPNPEVGEGRHDLRLDGEGLKLIALSLDGTPLAVTPDADGITIPASAMPDGTFTLTSEVEITPEANTALEGLYMSNGMYCTQCEAEGFRHITFYPDRPDVMARFRVRIESDLPVLLSNGNPGASGAGFAEWADPFPKPAYLFALVAGDLVAHSAAFTTASGKPVALNIWVRKGDEDKCAYAMDALIRSMRWDETEYGREYDLDVFNIVAVDDFNMGAMENKGLNIFNSRYVLASPETATDQDYENIERIIAHEYFHNWTGNRITCRDWFQLCLKEGLTVFRDQQFCQSQRSGAVKRIEEVLTLRARQFREDAGPLAHPVRPEEYREINNFYTATVYEKGAEVIGMLRRLVGEDGYGKALDLYFQRHDGDAATIEDWLAVFSDATGRDLTQFKRWYTDAGTPHLTMAEEWDAATGRFTLTFAQKTAPTPGQTDKPARVIPVAVGLLNSNGDEVLPTTVLEMTQSQQSFHFDGLAARPVASILRGFSAPVVLDREVSAREQAFLLAHDTDPFNKWEAGRSLTKAALTAMVLEGAAPAPALLGALAQVALDDALDPAFRALVLRMPSGDDMAQSLHAAGHVPDPGAIRDATKALALALAQRLHADLPALQKAMLVPGAFTPDAESAGKRSFGLALLALQSRLDGGAAARAVFDAADNMTEETGALATLLDIGAGEAEAQSFYDKWRTDRLVIDKWFGLQAMLASPDQAAAVVTRLTAHPDFDWKNPNRFRAVIGGLSGNAAGFHHPSGAGYRLVADWLIRLDPVNPQTTARMSTAFETWARYDAKRQALIRGELARIAGTPGLSRDTAEMVARMLGSATDVTTGS